MASTQKPVDRPRWLRVVHWVGYFTTALVLIELLSIGFFATRAWMQERQFVASQIEDSRTHEGPLSADHDIIHESAVYLMAQLPALGALHGDGLRFVAMPSFNQAHFAVAIYIPSPNAMEAQGVLSRFDQRNNYAPLGRREFRMPATAYRSLVGKIDTMTDHWPGDPGSCLDGTPTAFERVRGERVTSGVGNCSQHYRDLARLMADYLKRFAPGDDVPTRADWEPVPAR